MTPVCCQPVHSAYDWPLLVGGSTEEQTIEQVDTDRSRLFQCPGNAFVVAIEDPESVQTLSEIVEGFIVRHLLGIDCSGVEPQVFHVF